MNEIAIQIPARPEFVPVLRSVIASVASRLNLSFDGIDDLRLAVDEAAGHLLRLDREATILELRISPNADRIEVTGAIDASPSVWPPEDAQHTLTWQVLTGLTDEASFDQLGDRPAITFVKRLPA
jgi:serine/threonine-protein kinase RsbW